MLLSPLPFALLAAIAVSAERLTPPPAGQPVAELPGHVAAQPDKLTLFADFEHPGESGVPVYVVNRTAKPISFGLQDGDAYLKLEYESAPGKWTRAQSHAYSWCGNSYSKLELRPGRFMIVSGYRVVKGEKAKVRYRFYGQDIPTASNAGGGLVEKAEVERAATDEMTVREGDFDFVRKVALGEVKNLAHLRETAVLNMYAGEADRDEMRKVLEALTKDKDERVASAAGVRLSFLKKYGK